MKKQEKKAVKKKSTAQKNVNSKKMISVRIKILVPVILLAVISLCSSAIGIKGLRTVNRSSKVISDKNVKSIQLVDTMVQQFKDLEVCAYGICMSDNEKDKERYLQRMEDDKGQVTELAEQYEGLLTTEAEKERFDAMMKSYQNFLVILDQIKGYMDQGSADVAEDLCKGSLSERVVEVEEMVEVMSTSNVEAVNASVAKQETVYRTSFVGGAFMIILLMFTMGVVIYTVIKRVSRPIMGVQKE